MGKPTSFEVSLAELNRLAKQTRGTETSKYPEEKKSTEIPLVAASEQGVADNCCSSGTLLESAVIEGDNPVHETTSVTY